MSDIVKPVTFSAIAQALLAIDDSYKDDTKHWLRFLHAKKMTISTQSIKKYEEYLDEQRYSASTINKRLIAVKKRILFLFDHSKDFFDMTKRIRLEQALKNIKLRKMADHAINENKIITVNEKQILMQHANEKLQLMIEFLWKTALRISEMVNIKNDDIRTEKGIAYIRVLGKGKKERLIRVKSILIYQIRKVFKSKSYLFETKSGKKYRRNYPSDKIKELGRVWLGREISAHTLRHSFATRKIKETGKLKGISRYLGHSSTAITLDMYVHEQLKNEELEL